MRDPPPEKIKATHWVALALVFLILWGFWGIWMAVWICGFQAMILGGAFRRKDI